MVVIVAVAVALAVAVTVAVEIAVVIVCTKLHCLISTTLFHIDRLHTSLTTKNFCITFHVSRP